MFAAFAISSAARIRSNTPGHSVVRAGATQVLFGPWVGKSFASKIIHGSSNGSVAEFKLKCIIKIDTLAGGGLRLSALPERLKRGVSVEVNHERVASNNVRCTVVRCLRKVSSLSKGSLIIIITTICCVSKVHVNCRLNTISVVSFHSAKYVFTFQ